jgi:predicted dehydrogenase
MAVEQSQTIRVGVVGVGFAQEHLRQLQSLPGIRVDWLAYGHDRERADEIAQKHGIENITADWRELISAPLDAVVIVTPVALHYEIAKAALAANKLVVCDKPLALNFAEAEELAALADQSDSVAMTFFQWRFHAGPRTLRNWLRLGLLGEIEQIDLQFRHDFLALPTTLWPWRHRTASAGAGAFGDLGVHLIDLLLWLTGDEFHVAGAATLQVWKERTAIGTGETIDCETEDAGQALLRSQQGTIASIFVSRCSPQFRNIRLAVTADDGAAILEIDPETGTHQLEYRGGKRVSFPPEERSLAPYSVWLDAIQNNKRAEIPTFADGARAQKIMDDVLRIAGGGR